MACADVPGQCSCQTTLERRLLVLVPVDAPRPPSWGLGHPFTVPRVCAMGPGILGLGLFIQLHQGPSEPLHGLACRRGKRRDVYKSIDGVKKTQSDARHRLRVCHVLSVRGASTPRTAA